LEAAFINTGLQPGATGSTKNKPFQRFACEEKPLKRLIRWAACGTRLKPGVNETSEPDDPIAAFQRVPAIILAHQRSSIGVHRYCDHMLTARKGDARTRTHSESPPVELTRPVASFRETGNARL
jgi:hypothetical protein